MDFESEQRLIDALADNLLQLTPEELEAELLEEGIDPEGYAEEGRQIALRAIRNHFLRQRRELPTPKPVSASRPAGRLTSRLSLEELRKAIYEKLALLSPEQQQLTLCHRNLRELTLEDLRSTLEDLEDLEELIRDDELRTP